MAIYAPDGSLLTTLSDGTGGGVYAPDGTIRITVANPGKPPSQIFSGNTGTASIPSGSTLYFTSGLVHNTQSLVYVPTGKRGYFNSLRIITPGAPGANESWTFTLQKLFNDTSLTCTIGGTGSNSAADLTNRVLFEASDRWSLKVVSSANAAETNHILFSLLLDLA